jgi:arsenite methyltransferase
MKKDEIKKVVRDGYAQVAKGNASCCLPMTDCCGGASVAKDIGRRIGYSDSELQAVPEGANLGLGCGNPLALASLKEGEMVVDLGSGAGFDCFLAANQVGKSGKVIGVDMTPEMIDRARENACKGGYDQVEFRLGEIENLPVADHQADIIISNCVINLSPDKKRVFQEACRILKPGGRLMVSDIVLLRELPEAVKKSVAAYIGCLAGADLKVDYLRAIEEAGFGNVTVLDEMTFPVELMTNDPMARAIADDLKLTKGATLDLAASIVSVKVSGIKPA